MKGSVLLGSWLLWQSVSLVNIGTAAAPEHLQWQRAVVLPGKLSGPVCAELDAQVLAHAGSGAHTDLRVYRGFPGAPAQAETPYLLTESGPEPVGDAAAEIRNLRRAGSALLFDLKMPIRTYSEIDLRIRLHDFVGTVLVSADSTRKERTALGSFGIFDLTGQDLGSWTVLGLEEGSTSLLHLELTLRTPAGKLIRNLPLAVLAGVSVPPSRLRQTVFEPVLSAEAEMRGTSTVSIFHVPAHVPVERIRFELRNGFPGNYARSVTVRAKTDGDPAAETEVMDAGNIEHVRWASGDSRLTPIDVTENTVNATTGATLAGPATIRVSVLNGTEPPLPVRRVTLEMRERKICFVASPGAQYTLRYGDPALAAPIYDMSTSEAAGKPAGIATLGPEKRNPAWEPRRERRPYLDRHPEVFWLTVLVCGGLMGATGLHLVEQRGQERRD